MIVIKSAPQIEVMRKAGKIVAKTHELLERHIKPGIKTITLDRIAEDFIRSCGAIPSFKGYKGYPASINVSVNSEIIHGIPSSLKTLKNGDIVGIDIGVCYKGYHGDAARTYGIGHITDEDKKLILAARGSFFEAIKFAKPKMHLNQICTAIQDHVESHGFSVVREFIGHGIGKDLHEMPNIPNYRMKKRGPRLDKGMTLAIEPMVNMGTHELVVLEDGWTAVTMDGKNSAHYENTVLITDGEPEILTLL